MTDKMREDFEAWAIEEGLCATVGLAGIPESEITHFDENNWLSWQAATAESTAKIAQMQTELEAYRTKQRVYNSTEIAQMQARIDKSINYFIGILALSSSGSSAHAIALEALAKVKDVK